VYFFIFGKGSSFFIFQFERALSKLFIEKNGYFDGAGDWGDVVVLMLH